MVRKRVVDQAIDRVSTFADSLQHSIARVFNPVGVVAGPPDHLIGTTQPVQLIVALRSDQFIPKSRAFQKTAGR